VERGKQGVRYYYGNRDNFKILFLLWKIPAPEMERSLLLELPCLRRAQSLSKGHKKAPPESTGLGAKEVSN